MPLYETKNPLAPLRERATQLAQNGVQKPFASGGGGVSSSPPVGSGGTRADADGYTIKPLIWGVDSWDDPSAVWLEDL